MTSSVRQMAFWDPNPSNFGSFTVGTLSGIVADASAVGSYVTFALDTLPGSAIVLVVMTAYDGTNLVTNACDTINGSYTLVDDVLNTFGSSNMDSKSFILPNAQILKAAGWSGTAHLTTGGPSFIIDSTTSGHISIGDVVQGAGVPHGCVIQSLTSGTPDQAGAVYNLPSPAGSVNISSEAMSTANSVLVRYNHSGDYEGMIAFEITGVSANPLVGHAAQALSLVTGTDAATSGVASCGSSPILMIGVAINGNDGHSPYAPNVGTGFANWATALQFNLGQALSSYEYQNFANPGSKAATFTPSGATDDFTVHMLALLDQPPGVFMGQILT